ncbi:DUF4960 domain-containing protein [Capnocytophaga haemolytica]
MKSILHNIAIAAFSLIGLWACDKTHEGELINDREAKINSFKAQGMQGIISEEDKTITVYAPWSYDLTKMTTDISLPAQATVVPASGAVVDLSQGAQFRVFNGNLYWDYTATAKHPSIESFAVGKYKATIDNAKGVITLKYPSGEAVTALTPVISTTPGATLSPASGVTQNFTQSVTYTLSYAGESFAYTVNVVPTSFAPIAFLGTADNASAIADEDEKDAYNWLISNYDTAKYISFKDIKEGKVKLSDYKVIWWHLDTDASDLPAIASDAAVVEKLKQYYAAGGSFLLTSWADQYVATLGIAKDGKVPNNLWGQNNKPFDVNDDWGIRFTGNETHPLFKGLNLKAGSTDVAYLVSKGVKAKGHNAIWNFEWGDYANNPAAWQTASGAKLLASFHWNDTMNRAIIFEYTKSGNSGKTICIGTESYDWHTDEGTNTYKANMELLTVNALEYLAK